MILDPRERVSLGGTGLAITRLGLGGGPVGGLFEEVSDSTATKTVDQAWDIGVRLFDTAPLYGFGVSERRIGAALGRRPRSDFVLSTKVGRLLTAAHAGAPGDALGRAPWRGAPPLTPIFDFSEAGVIRSLEESLDRLGLDRVDVVYIHDPGDHYTESLRGAFRALNRLRREGTIGAVGVGMNEWQMLSRFARAGRFDCFLLAGRYTLLDQSALATFLPLCVERGISVIAGGVYNSGIIADPYGRPTFDYLPAARHWVDKAKRLAAACERHDVPLKAAAIQFPFGHPAIVSVLIGSRSPEEIEENARMLVWEIPEELWDDLRTQGLIGDSAPIPSRASRGVKR
jgi:D-threo-aldose 1-dehydrogenase